MKLTPMKPGWKRALKWTGLVAVLFFAFVAFAHTPWGRPMLAWLSGVPGCPAGFGEGDPAKVEAFRRQSLAERTAGTAPAQGSTRPALAGVPSSFELGKTSRQEVEAWLGPAISQCKPLREGQALSCENPKLASSAAGLPVGDLHLQFDADVLVAVDVIYAESDATQAMTHLASVSDVLVKGVGPATKTHGEVEPTWLAAQPLRQTLREFRYRGYVAQLSVTNLGSRGIRMREQYQWTAM